MCNGTLEFNGKVFQSWESDQGKGSVAFRLQSGSADYKILMLFQGF